MNILRTTNAAFAAVTGGADALTVLPFDHRIERTHRGHRIARNIHSVLDEECLLSQVSDPAAGSYFVENKTDEFCARAWAQFQEIEKNGGIAALLMSGKLLRQLREKWEARRFRISNRSLPLTGVSEFPNSSESVPESPKNLQSLLQSESLRLKSFYINRGEGPTIGGADMRQLQNLVFEGVTCLELSAAFGLNTTMTLALERHYDSEVFESIRDQVHELTSKPAVFLANIGFMSEWNPRAMFATNLFAAGGFEALSGSGTSDLDSESAAASLVEQFKKSGAAFICICGTNKAYQSHISDLIKALLPLKVPILLAGKMEIEGLWSCVYRNCDAAGLLERMLLEVQSDS